MLPASDGVHGQVQSARSAVYCWGGQTLDRETSLDIPGYSRVRTITAKKVRNCSLFLSRFIITFVFIWPILRKYLDRPTITTIGTRNYPIWKVNTLFSINSSTLLVTEYQIDFPGVTICPSNKVVEEKLRLIQSQSPWAEDIEEFGEINFDKLLHLLTGFRSIARDKWDDFEELNGVIDRLGQGNLTTLMQKVKMKIIFITKICTFDKSCISWRSFQFEAAETLGEILWTISSLQRALWVVCGIKVEILSLLSPTSPTSLLSSNK